MKAGKKIKLLAPPKNKIALREHISNIFAYSPNEKRAKDIAEYSTL